MTFVKRAAAVLSITLAVFGTAAGAATAAPATTASGDVSAMAEWSKKFSRETTQGLYAAVITGGALAGSGACVKVVPGLFKVACPVFGAFVANYFVNRPPAGRCLQVKLTTKPSASAKYVTC
ncbi:hypothetical protein NLX83_04405 [Allokutzneria sp. A3M-2-11 16]|uniref:hypothetical protein n=1 Tax=Allokutzneria sp. A3M-2-11 16 TaxID=2962043 RepID=UPI0020B7FEF2|nr:hypothetical protein [Allokutzneria sp. A3M-2-11 16]MCP3798495.1 hypothetical protein [Allokutzneria sp. A3M-2-11 16]